MTRYENYVNLKCHRPRHSGSVLAGGVVQGRTDDGTKGCNQLMCATNFKYININLDVFRLKIYRNGGVPCAA